MKSSLAELSKLQIRLSNMDKMEIEDKIYEILNLVNMEIIGMEGNKKEIRRNIRKKLEEILNNMENVENKLYDIMEMYWN